MLDELFITHCTNGTSIMNPFPYLFLTDVNILYTLKMYNIHVHSYAAQKCEVRH